MPTIGGKLFLGNTLRCLDATLTFGGDVGLQDGLADAVVEQAENVSEVVIRRKQKARQVRDETS